MASSLHTLPVELVYRILDNLNKKTIFLSLSNVCTRLNAIINTYHPYQVNFSCISSKHSFKKILFFSPLTVHSFKTCSISCELR